MRIRLTSLAARDLESVEEFTSQDNPRAAIKVVIRILDAIETLREFPNVGRPGRMPGTRELVVGGTPFIAIYKVRENVIHGARRWP